MYDIGDKYKIKIVEVIKNINLQWKKQQWVEDIF